MDTLLKRAREKAGYQSAADFARTHGITETTYRSHENGNRDISNAAARKYAPLLGLEWTDLVSNEVEAMNKALDTAIAPPPPLNTSTPDNIPQDNIIGVARYDAALSSGPGSLIDPNAAPLGVCYFEAQWLRTMTQAGGAQLAVVRVDGDAMDPTLAQGDWVLIDRTQTKLNREGVYALRVGDMVWIKRISLNLATRKVQIISDNTSYPMQELAEQDLQILGRAVWIIGRKV